MTLIDDYVATCKRLDQVESDLRVIEALSNQRTRELEHIHQQATVLLHDVAESFTRAAFDVVRLLDAHRLECPPSLIIAAGLARELTEP